MSRPSLDHPVSSGKASRREPELVCEAIFDVSDAEAAKRRLAAQPHMEADAAGFVWHELREAKKHSSRAAEHRLVGGVRVLGRIVFRDGRLVLETRSRQQLELGKTMLEGLLAGLARHRVDIIEDAALAERSR